MNGSDGKNSRGNRTAFTFVLGGILFMLLFPKIHAALITPEGRIQQALYENEQLVDYVIDGQNAYAFVSTNGDRNYGDRFLVLTESKNSWKRVYENEFTGLKPWKVEVADIDGDGKQDIVAAVKKTTFYDTEEKNRLFIFDYTDGKLVKKWTGSDIAGSWEDFTVGELVETKGEELIFISNTEEGKEKLLVYHWYDFGFLLLAQSEDYEDMIEVEIVKENCLRLTYHKGKEQRVLLMLKKGRVTEV